MSQPAIWYFDAERKRWQDHPLDTAPNQPAPGTALRTVEDRLAVCEESTPPRQARSGWPIRVVRRLLLVFSYPFTRSPRPESVLHIPHGTTALVIPAHNEEGVIGAALRSALAIYASKDIYVFCDGCTDGTAGIARGLLPEQNVIVHRENIGKSRGVEYTLGNSIFNRGYRYVTVLDADSTLAPDFLQQSLRVLRRKDVAATVGQVKSTWHSNSVLIAYRAYANVIFQAFHKRPQSWLNAVSIASGTATTWKTAALRQLSFDHRLSIEDINLTVQAHRRKIGKIKYVPSAVVWTQEPFTLKSYRKQMYRWTRSWWEVVRMYHLGLHPVRFWKVVPCGISMLDVVTFVLLADMILFWCQVVFLPILLLLAPEHVRLGPWVFNTRQALLWDLAWQYGLYLVMGFIAAAVLRRPRIFFYSPLFIAMAYMDFTVMLKALTSVLRNQYPEAKPNTDAASASIWTSPERMEVT